VRIVHQDDPRAVGHGGRKRSRSGWKSGQSQRHGDQSRAGQRHDGRVRVVVGLEDDDLVVGRVDQRQDVAASASVAPAVVTTSRSGSRLSP
jgi:hypothetical protein